MIAGASCDVLVIGHGAAGCVVSAALAGRGLDVIMVGRGTTATELSTGRIALGNSRAADILRSAGRDHGLYLSGQEGEAVTNVGTLGHQDLTSNHDWLAVPGDRVAVLGLRGNEDLDPDLACRSLSYRAPSTECAPLWADPGIARSVDAGRGITLSDEAREAIDRLSGIISEVGPETVVLPPLFVGPLYDHALTVLESASGRRVREAATPLSNPGRRLQACLEAHAIRSGCRLLAGREVRSMRFHGSLAASAEVTSGLREQTIQFRAAVLAAGGLVSGGLVVREERAVDPLGLFAVGGPQGSETGLPVLSAALSAGILEQDGHVLRADGTKLKNVMVAGSSLPGQSFVLGKGIGEVVSSALRAAELTAEAL
ncbi:MAG: FAD-dependent monooxygenase [Methanomassiliicoccus sp.]|nr:FAD-dependent monooxygenase [Methanomassiliicoccus sp.]